MLENLKSFENLGTPQYFFILLNTLNDNSDSIWKIKNVEDLFYNKVIDGKSSFDGCLSLAKSIDVIMINENDEISLNNNFKKYLHNERLMCDRFIENLFLSFNKDDNFHDIFSSENISYDIIYRSIQIKNSAFKFKYAGFKQLLLDFGVIEVHPTKKINNYIFNSRYRKLFDKVLLPEIKKRKIGIEDLKRSLEQKRIHGEQAERFVLAYEKKRLNNKDGIDWVAEYSPSDGYDIASFNSSRSKSHDRFIEVKSYEGFPYFYWSRNEMDVARVKKNEYFLYLVNRNEMQEETYRPLIIQNPFENVLNDDTKWEVIIENLKIQQK